MSVLKKLAGQTALYGLSSMVGRMVNFLLVPFYTAMLGSAEFGIVTELYAYMAFFNVIYLFGMETAYFRYATKGTLDPDKVYNHSLTLITISSIAFSGILILFSRPEAAFLRYPDQQMLVVYTALILAIDAICAIPFARLRLENKVSKFVSIKLVNIFLNIFFNIFFLVFCKKIYAGEWLPSLQSYISVIYNPGFDLAYIFISNLIANAIMMLLLWKSFLIVKPSLYKEMGKEMWVYAYPLLFMGLAGMTNEVLSRIILKYLLTDNFYPGRTSLEALGIFGACYKLSMFMTLAVQSFRYAGEPFFFSRAQDKNAPELFAKVMKWFIIACLFIFVVVSANLPVFGLLLRSPEYREGLMIVPVLLMANLFLGVYYSLSPWYKLTDKTYFGTWISIGGAVVTVIANIVMIPFFGYMGSAIATLLCYFLMAVVSYIIGQKYYPIPYKTGNAILYILISIVLVVLAIELPEILVSKGLALGMPEIITLQFLITLSFPAIVFVLEKKEMRFKA